MYNRSRDYIVSLAVQILDCKNGETYDENIYKKCPKGFIGSLCTTEKTGLCTDGDSANSQSIILITFGSGNQAYSNKTAEEFNFTTSYTQSLEDQITYNTFVFVNKVPAVNEWHSGASDYTTDDTDGYMLLVNVGEKDEYIFKYQVSNLCIGLRYEFSAYLANVMVENSEASGDSDDSTIKIIFRVKQVSEAKESETVVKKTDDISAYENMIWEKHGLSFVAQATDAVLLLDSKVNGNPRFIAIDDIKLRVCSANRSVSVLPISYNEPEICPNATWDQTGVTVVNQPVIGKSTPGIFVDTNNTLYVASNDKKRIFIFFENGTNSTHELASSFEASTIFVITNDEIYFQNSKEQGQVERWSRNLMSSVPVAEFKNRCYGLFIDTSNTLYCSMYDNNKVQKKSLSDNSKKPETVTEKLSKPLGISVDTHMYLYVADSDNNRIQLFKPGQKKGTTVAGKGIQNKLELSNPTDLVLDADGDLFIVDNGNDRVIRANEYDYWCIIGCNGSQRSTSNPLIKPYALRFDRRGNLFVADKSNYRVQKFTIKLNSCKLDNAASLTNKTISVTTTTEPTSITTETTSAITVATTTTTETTSVTTERTTTTTEKTSTTTATTTTETSSITTVANTTTTEPTSTTTETTTMTTEKTSTTTATITTTTETTSGNTTTRVITSTATPGVTTTTESKSSTTAASTSFATTTLTIATLLIERTTETTIREAGPILIIGTPTERIAMAKITTNTETTAVPMKVTITATEARSATEILMLTAATSTETNLTTTTTMIELSTEGISTETTTESTSVTIIDTGSARINTTTTESITATITLTETTVMRIGTTVISTTQALVPTTTATIIVTARAITETTTTTTTDITKKTVEMTVTMSSTVNTGTTATTITITEVATAVTTTKTVIISTVTTTTQVTTATSIETTITTATNNPTGTETGTDVRVTAFVSGNLTTISAATTTKRTSTSTIRRIEFNRLTSSTTMSTTKSQQRETQPPFVPTQICNNSQIGVNCNVSNSPCDLLKPCQNNGICERNPTDINDYNCLCSRGFNGTHCELDHRTCKPQTCLGHGECKETPDLSFFCWCHDGWTGIHCQSRIDNCSLDTCENDGVCRPILLNYTCECLGDSYSGRHCEIPSMKTTILKTVSKSFAYIAIIAMISVAMFIVIMDILKYCFGMDPTRGDLERIQQKRRKSRVVLQLVYVHSTATPTG
ncbi:unnamed protein product [Rotaria magnacalcarata]|uniref:EGF-like domain-containing protein n=2 Tax=Rotaria magnacalcarata TaxID=392030 RepID=A0A816VVC9_9BILA|nr:unnamed protein product [Rotaria magnacalcarata]CAF4080333.1 unnamed protein product [Rotaria magnacalcarata]